MVETNEDRKPRDFWLGLMFLGFGALILAYVTLAIRNGIPFMLWLGGVALAPVLLLLGASAVWKSLRARD